MKKVLMIIPYFILWCLYVMLTMEERNRYLVAKSRGMDCVHSHFDGFYVGGTVDKYYFDPKAKPTRRYMTWSEFWKSKGYIK